jgi:hypothetical protein
MKRSLAAVHRSSCLLAGIALGVFACASPREGLNPSDLPDAVRPDYAVFAQRCSKCHSLSRPLNSGIDDDQYWIMYVARMRRQPASGISKEDEVEILRFLHYFSVEARRKKGASSHADTPTLVPAVPAPAHVVPAPAPAAPEGGT